MSSLNSQSELFWNELEKLIYAEIESFNTLKTDEDIVAAFGSKGNVDVIVNKSFFTNIATSILKSKS